MDRRLDRTPVADIGDRLVIVNDRTIDEAFDEFRTWLDGLVQPRQGPGRGPVPIRRRPEVL